MAEKDKKKESAMNRKEMEEILRKRIKKVDRCCVDSDARALLALAKGMEVLLKIDSWRR